MVDACQRPIHASAEDGAWKAGAILGWPNAECSVQYATLIQAIVSTREERMTMGAKFRIGLAAGAVFIAIAGIVAAIHGLVFDQERALRFGVAAVIGGVAAFVLLLNPAHGMDEDAHRDH